MTISKPLLTTLLASLLLGACNHVTPQTTESSPPENTSATGATTPENNESATTQDSTTQGQPLASTEYTLEDISQHSTPDDCWLAIEAQVYDVTDFIASGNHGGGDAILEGCGKEATELFNTRPMGSGTPHSSTARGFLPNFQIGTLSE